MNAARVIVTAAAVLALAACGSSGTARTAATTAGPPASAAAASQQASLASASADAAASASCSLYGGTWNGTSCDTAPPVPDTGTTDGSPFACSTVVDSNDDTSPFKAAQAGSITAQDAIAYLEALEVADVVDLSAGDVNATAAAVLDGTAQDLRNYHLDKLADDAQQYFDDEQSYNPDGPVDTSAWPAVQSDITALGKDCPGALREAMHIDGIK